MLFVLTDADYPTIALEQAALLAHAIEGRLHVQRVLSESRPFAPCWPDLDVVEATRRIQSCLAATRRTKSWCDQTLWEPLPVRQLRIRVGHFVEDVARRADESIELGAQLGTPVVAVHNVSRLEVATERLRGPMEAVLSDEADPVDAILKQGRAHHATIVVGTRSSARLEGLVEGSIAAQVVNRSDRSVVVTPRSAAKPYSEGMSVGVP